MKQNKGKTYSNKNIYEFLSEEIKYHPEIDDISAKELKQRKDDTDFWESLSEKLDCFRICDACHKPMIEGFCIDEGDMHFCSKKCLHTEMSEEEYQEMAEDEDSTTYYTTWYEDSKTYTSNM